YNLNKIARLEGVEVINLNDLANAMKPIVLPGENLTVKILKKGEEQGQGVGYLDDGTMVVAEHGAYHLGETIRLTVTSVLQTSAGRMIFGRIDQVQPSRAAGSSNPAGHQEGSGRGRRRGGRGEGGGGGAGGGKRGGDPAARVTANLSRAGESERRVTAGFPASPTTPKRQRGGRSPPPAPARCRVGLVSKRFR